MGPDQRAVEEEAWHIRDVIERIFADDTRAPRRASLPPSTGHCAVTALLVRDLLGGDVLAVTHPTAGAHWYNRIRAPNWLIWVDLTLDQFMPHPCPVPLRSTSMVGPDPWPALRQRSIVAMPGAGLEYRFELFRDRFFEADR